MSVALKRSQTLIYVDDSPMCIHNTVNPKENSTPIVFLHGWGISPRSYQSVCNEIAQNGHNVFAPAIPGFGGSEPLHDPQHDTYNRTVQHILATIQASDLPSPIPFVGHSYGAGIAVSIAHQHPELISHLILICPIGGSGPSVLKWLTLISGIRYELPQHPIERMFDVIPSLTKNPVAFAANGIAAKHTNLHTILTQVVSSGIPVTLVAADQDKIVPIGELSRIPYATHVKVHGTHGWLLHEPKEAADLVEAAITYKLYDDETWT